MSEEQNVSKKPVDKSDWVDRKGLCGKYKP